MTETEGRQKCNSQCPQANSSLFIARCILSSRRDARKNDPMGAAFQAIVAVSGLAARLFDQTLGNRLGVFFAKETSQIGDGLGGRIRE
jgi:hypothetical protein